MKKASYRELKKIRGVASYQLGRGVGEALFKRGVMIVHSRRTGRIRHIYSDRKLLATLRANDGMLALAIEGGKLLMKSRRFKNVVKVQTDVSDFIKNGRNVFAKHVVQANPAIRPEDEVIVIDEKGGLLATGRAFLSGEEMLSFKRGVAVRVRHGISES